MICGIISDTHNHNWTAFSHTDEDGLNSRLHEILKEIERAAKVTKDRGGEMLIHCGDLFHVRGNVAPSVMNPTIDTFRRIALDYGLKVVFISGNHDCEFADADKAVGNSIAPVVKAMTSEDRLFTEVGGYEADNLYFIPWQNSVDAFKVALEDIVKNKSRNPFIFTHAPIDGVVEGVPCSGINVDYLEKVASDAMIFAGHYHNHKQLTKNIYSVGAIAQHTWSDISSKAGFMILDTETRKAEFCDSCAPKFVDLNGELSEEELLKAVDNNYVRLSVSSSIEDAKKLQETLVSELGAKGVTLNIIDDKPTLKRDGFTLTVAHTSPLNVTISDYLNEKLKGRENAYIEEVKRRALEILSTVES